MRITKAMLNAYAKPFDHFVKVSQLAVVRGGRRVFKNISFALAPSQIMHVRGANGAGKSTLLRSLLGLCIHDQGEITYSGGFLADHAHYVPSESAVKAGLTLYEHLLLWSSLNAVQMDEALAISALHKAGFVPKDAPKDTQESTREDARVGAREHVRVDVRGDATKDGIEDGIEVTTGDVAENAPEDARLGTTVDASKDALKEVRAMMTLKARYLSSGQRKKLHLASLFLVEKPLWLLDEPLNGLDQKSTQQFYQQIKNHLAMGGMVIYTDHSEQAAGLKEVLPNGSWCEVML